MPEIRIATFNVNSVRSRVPVLERWLAEERVDALCLQETKTTDAAFPADFFEGLGYHVVYSGEKAYNGVAIAALTPLADVFRGFPDGRAPADSARLLGGRMGEIVIVNSYVPQGKAIDHRDYQYKLAFFERLRRLFLERYEVNDKILWLGDLNVAPTPLDVTHPENKRQHVCYHEAVRAAFENTKAWGFEDVFRKHRPQAGEFTFWDYRVKDALARNIGWRIDHVLATPSLAALSLDCYTDRRPRAWEKPSDHAPVVCRFNVPKAS